MWEQIIFTPELLNIKACKTNEDIFRCVSGQSLPFIYTWKYIPENLGGGERKALYPGHSRETWKEYPGAMLKAQGIIRVHIAAEDITCLLQDKDQRMKHSRVKELW